MSALLETLELELAKNTIDELFQQWIIVPDTVLPVEDLSFSTTASIQDYLETQVSKDYFQELLHYALEKAKNLPSGLRLETLEYLWGGAHLAVERSQYTQLMAMLKQYLPTESSAPCSFYLSAAEVATEIAFPVLVIAAFSMMPSVAAMSSPVSSNDSTDNGSCLSVDYEKTHRDVVMVERQMRALTQRMGRDYDDIPKDEFIQPSVDVRTTAGAQKIEALAGELCDFYEGNLTLRQEKELIHILLNDPDSIQPLNVILMNAKDKEMLYKIVFKLSRALYVKIMEEDVRNLDSLVLSLGQVLVKMPPDASQCSLEEAETLVHFLFLYQSSSPDKMKIAEKIRIFIPPMGSVYRFSSQAIANIVQWDPSRKSTEKHYLSGFLKKAKDSIVNSLEAKEKSSLTYEENLFLEIYSKVMKATFQLFFDEGSLSIWKKNNLLRQMDAVMSHYVLNKDTLPNTMLLRIYEYFFFQIIEISRNEFDWNQFLDLGRMKKIFNSDPNTGVKVFEIMGVRGFFLLDRDSIIKYYKMAKYFEKKNERSWVDDFFCDLLQELKETPDNCRNGLYDCDLLQELKEMPLSCKKGFYNGEETTWPKELINFQVIFWECAALLISYGALGGVINAYSAAPEELHTHLSDRLYAMSGAKLSIETEYYTGWWLTRLSYNVVQYQLFAFFTQSEREAWLESHLSTSDFVVQATAKKEELLLTIKAKNWRRYWKNYFEYLSTISRESICVKEKLSALLKENLNQVKFSDVSNVRLFGQNGVVVRLNLTSEVFAVDEEGISFEPALSKDPFVYRKIELLFKEKGFESVRLDKDKFSFAIPFSAVEDGYFTEPFGQKLNEIDVAVGIYIEKRKQDFANLQPLMTSFENENMSCEMGDLNVTWTCKSENTSDLYVLQYLLHFLYGIESTIQDNKVIHNLPEEHIPLKPEAKNLIENMTVPFRILESRYKLASCMAVFKEGKICMKISSRDKTTLLLIKEELSSYGLGIDLQEGYILIDFSVKKPVCFNFNQSFSECLQDRMHLMKKEKEKEALISEQKIKEEKTETVLKELNDRLEPFLPAQGLGWKRISDTEIGLVLEKERYYCVVKEQSLLISKEALIELIRCDFKENNNSEKEIIFERRHKKSPIKSRLELHDPWLIQVGTDSIVQRHSALLKPLSRLSETFYPMTISLNYIGGQFTISVKFDEMSEEKLQSWGFSDKEFRDEFIDKVWETLKMRAERREGNEFILSLEDLKFVEFPRGPILQTLEQEWLNRKASAEIEISNVIEFFRDEKDKKKGKEKEESKNKEKRKEKPVIKFSSSKGPQFFTHYPIALFHEENSKKDLEMLLGKVQMDLSFLKSPEGDTEMNMIEREFVLYADLSNLLEELVQCAKQFECLHCIKPNWFNIPIEDFSALRELRVEVIKNVNIPNHRMFCRQIAKKISDMLFGPFNINIKEMKAMARTEAVISEFKESGNLNTEEENIEYDHIRALVEALKNIMKWGDIRSSVIKNMDYVRGLIIFTKQIFDKKRETSSPDEMIRHLGAGLYWKLHTHGNICRNLGVHEANSSQEATNFVRFITELNAENFASSSSSHSASSKCFGV